MIDWNECFRFYKKYVLSLYTGYYKDLCYWYQDSCRFYLDEVNL